MLFKKHVFKSRDWIKLMIVITSLLSWGRHFVSLLPTVYSPLVLHHEFSVSAVKKENHTLILLVKWIFLPGHVDVVKPQDSMDHILRMIKNICMSSPHYRHKYAYSFSSVAQSCPTLRPHESRLARPVQFSCV